MVFVALKIAFVYYLIYFIDTELLSWQCLTRPIVVAPIAGLVLGDFSTGIIMGAALESIFMGISAIGGAIPADVTTSSVIAVAFTILSGADAATGLAIALPIGTAMSSINNIFTPVWASLAGYWEKLAAECNPKKFLRNNFLIGLLQPLVGTIVLFLSVAYGVEGLESFLAIMPEWVMTGLVAATSMMLAVGFAILTSMIWSKEVGVFFFLGYVLVAYMHVDTLGIAIIGVVIAVTIFLQSRDLNETKNYLQQEIGNYNNTKNNEEDFFE